MRGYEAPMIPPFIPTYREVWGREWKFPSIHFRGMAPVERTKGDTIAIGKIVHSQNWLLVTGGFLPPISKQSQRKASINHFLKFFILKALCKEKLPFKQGKISKHRSPIILCPLMVRPSEELSNPHCSHFRGILHCSQWELLGRKLLKIWTM